ncbi:MAG TPA: DUF2088 domain-containing protein [Armatimonadetes bacterium]|nr:DUF2088 domain-containing protein [Armatimonadota bacterium]
MNFPQMYKVKQKLYAAAVEDVPTYLRQRLAAFALPDDLRGQRICLTAGSRGIANIAVILRTLVEEIERRGGKPFLVPAMGSHGGATAEGQVHLLEGLGITGAAVGAPIKATLEVVELGTTPEGFPIYLDRHAAEAEGIVVVNRIKKHTDFTAELESGLMKMMAIGLGKRAQAEIVHSHRGWGLRHIMPAVARGILQHAPILLGLAILENGYGQTADLVPLAPEEMEEREKRLLVQVKKHLPRLPFEELDVLIVEEMGKDISGTGMDTNVLGRLMLHDEPELESPRILVVAVLDLTPASHGNAAGLGLADLTTQQLIDQVDFTVTNTNVLVSGFIERGRTPMVLPTEEEVLQAALHTVRWKSPSEVRLVRIRNTSRLDELLVSEALLAEVEANPDLELVGPVEGMGKLRP